MIPPFGFQNAPMRHLASIGSFIITLLIGISAIQEGILNGYVGQFVAIMKGATTIKFWLGWENIQGSSGESQTTPSRRGKVTYETSSRTVSVGWLT
jgi:hypothetical protein